MLRYFLDCENFTGSERIGKADSYFERSHQGNKTIKNVGDIAVKMLKISQQFWRHCSENVGGIAVKMSEALLQ